MWYTGSFHACGTNDPVYLFVVQNGSGVCVCVALLLTRSLEINQDPKPETQNLSAFETIDCQEASTNAKRSEQDEKGCHQSPVTVSQSLP